MTRVREPAVAGLFYPAEPERLRAEVRRYLDEADRAGEGNGGLLPKAIVAPHAGYIYSAPVAASAYARLAKGRGIIRRVVLLGPAHRLAFRGIATSSADCFRTPLGDVPVDLAAVAAASRLPQVRQIDQAHLLEHSLEVHLPFLQELLGEFSVVPLLVGEAETGEVAELIELLWDGPETVIVVSSDLSHYHDYATACAMDRATTRAIEALAPLEIGVDAACGRNPLRGLLEVGRRHGYSMETVDLRNSGDTAGPRERVVGYGAYLLH